MSSNDLRARYEQLTHHDDPLVREMATRQLAQLGDDLDDIVVTAAAKPAASRWAYIPLSDLFTAAGNRVFPRGKGQFETGHAPVYSSNSGRCALLTPNVGWWYCRQCRKGGNAVKAVMSLQGITYTQAVNWLTQRYGLPPNSRPPKRRIVSRRPVLEA